MALDLTDEKIEWLNGFFTKEDAKEIGVRPTKLRLKTRRWQLFNVAQYATGQEVSFGPQVDERFIV